MKRFKNTTFREGYNPSFPEFKKSHASIIALEDMAEAYKIVSGKEPTKTQKQALQKEINGNTSKATGKGEEDNATASK